MELKFIRSFRNPGGSVGKESTCHVGDPGSIHELGRSTREGIGYPLQYPLASLGSDGKVSAHNVGDLGSVPELGRSPGEENGNPFQYSFLEHSIESGTLWATVHRVAQSYM